MNEETKKKYVADVWLSSSALQKAIRRGEEERAVQAAISLWHQDSQRLYRRLRVVMFEDVGIGQPDLLAKAVSLSGWEETVDLVCLLCSAVKNRLADSVFIQAERAAEHRHLRERLAKASDRTLARYVRDEEKPLVERAIAISLLGSSKAIAAIMALSLPADFKEACITAIPLMRWPLPRHLPLIYQEAQKHQLRIQHHALPVMPDYQSLPLYAADGFTRVGKQCFGLLRQAVPDLRTYNINQIGLGIFYLSGGLVDKELTSPELEAIQRAGEIADITSAGLTQPDYMRLRDCLMQHMDMLADIRQEQLHRHLTGGDL